MKSPQNSDLEIAVIGGSLVGPATEIFLRNAGFRNVTTYEGSAIAQPQSGGVMGIRPHTVQTLTDAKLPVKDAEAFASQEVVSFDLVDRKPRPRKRDIFPGKLVTWDGLHGILADPINIQHGHTVVGLQVSDSGRPEIRFANAAPKTADLVVFADGRKSTGRALLDPDRQMTYNGYVVWRGLTQPPTPEPTGFYRYYDDQHGALFSITEPVNGSGLSYWEFSHNLPAGTFLAMSGYPPSERSFLTTRRITPEARKILEAFAEVHLPPVFADVVQGTTENLMCIPITDLPAPQRAAWPVGTGAAVLLSDAIATVRLQSGAGLNSGIEQAARLVSKLSNGTDLKSALRRWQAHTIDSLTPWIELGRVRASRTNLGVYEPTRPGYTVPAVAPSGDAWEPPHWAKAA